MKKEGYYSSGDFAKKAHITKKTLRYYDEHNILKPSLVTDTGARFYSDYDFAKLQQILFLKYLSFSLKDIKEMTLRNDDRGFWEESLKMQANLVDERIQQLKIMQTALSDAALALEEGQDIDWSYMLNLVDANELEQKLKSQYINSANISARINLHKDYSTNKEGWFKWLFKQCDLKAGDKVLEIGCGDASLWTENLDSIMEDVEILITDISDGIIREAEKKLESVSNKIKCQAMDAHDLSTEDRYDIVIANHMLFYCEDIDKVIKEIYRVLKPGGRLVCSTYGKAHMREVSDLVKAFDDQIVLSAETLYEKFGKENGKDILLDTYAEVDWISYEDQLVVDKPEPIIAYILSCHGNQNRFIVDHYHEFYDFVKKRTDKKYVITKDAGVFIARKE